MEAVRCAHCRLLVVPVTSTSAALHFAQERDGFAVPADDIAATLAGERVCLGSDRIGQVVKIKESVT